MPAPMTAPIASMIKSPAPRTRFSDCSVPSLASSSAMGLRANKDMRILIGAGVPVVPKVPKVLVP